MTPEPALRPRGRRSYAVDIVRHARIYRGGDGNALIVRDRHGREQQYPLGPGGIVRAVFVSPPEDGAVPKVSAAERWGTVVFKGGDGQEILRVSLAEWLPEAGVIGLMHLRPSECLERAGLRQFVTDLGIPLETQPESAAQAASDGQRVRSVHAVHRDLPTWHSWARGIGSLVWFAFFFVVPMTGHGTPWTALVAAAGLFLVPGTDLAFRFMLWSRIRRDASLAGADTVVPAPEAGSGATHRFCNTASVRVLPEDVVLTNTVGEERWIPRKGACGVSRLVRLVDPASGRPVGVEFRDNANEARALLAWNWWFAGPKGNEAWSRLVVALGVPVADEELKRTQKAGPWWTGHALAADVRKTSPMGAKEARKETGWHSSVTGSGEPIVVPVLSLLLVFGLASDQGPARVAGVLAVLTIVATLVPAAAQYLASSLKLDRPAASESL